MASANWNSNEDDMNYKRKSHGPCSAQMLMVLDQRWIFIDTFDLSESDQTENRQQEASI
jgi:hypothetical protein